MKAHLFFLSGLWMLLYSATAQAEPVVTLNIETPMTPPEWALLERELLNANTDACQQFFSRYFDQRGYLLCVERWGGDDGPDDAIENCNDWPLLYALGAHDVVRELYRLAWEGHLRQFTEVRTVEVPIARDGMYYKECPCMCDWQHNNEGLLVFHQIGLSEPDHPRFRQRVRRYAGFYMNEDPGAQNCDPTHDVIRSLFNGSRGPLLRKATALDWTGDPIEVENRFDLRHDERSYEEMLAHFKDYNDIVGDHPLNLLSTSLALHTYMVTGEEKYKRWLLDYVNAWRQRMINNNNIIPSNIGLDGTIGGECDGKWYGGAYGWGFTVVVPQTGELADRAKRPEIERLATRFPKLRLVIDHCFNLNSGESLKQTLADVLKLAQLPNIHAKLTFIATGSAEPYPCRDLHEPCLKIIETFGADRCVWGSGFPCEMWCPKISYGKHLRIFTDELGLDEVAKQWVLGKTAQQLWFDRSIG